MFKKLKTMVMAVKSEIMVYQRILKDSRTPRLAEWLLGISVGYVLLPYPLTLLRFHGKSNLDE
jgi:uncharacterized membrane protein YkvA (DUF1232 family)